MARIAAAIRMIHRQTSVNRLPWPMIAPHFDEIKERNRESDRDCRELSADSAGGSTHCGKSDCKILFPLGPHLPLICRGANGGKTVASGQRAVDTIGEIASREKRQRKANYHAMYGSHVQVMEAQLDESPALAVLARTVPGGVNSAFRGLFYTGCGFSSQAVETNSTGQPTAIAGSGPALAATAQPPRAPVQGLTGSSRAVRTHCVGRPRYIASSFQTA